MRLTLYLAGSAIALIVAFLLLKPPTATTAPAPSEAQSVAQPANSNTVPGDVTIDIHIQASRRTEGPVLTQVPQGNRIVLRVTSDAADEFHLHGYDLHLDLEPGTPGELSFLADRSGRFEYELHHTHRSLGVIEVHPP